MAEHITHDVIYDTVAPNDFRAMVEVDRYNRRTDAFDGIISATHDHFWDPLDKAYIDFDQPFDIKTQLIVPFDQFIEFSSALTDKLDEGQQICLCNDIMRWNLSNILHGEQGALSLSASLCHILKDPGAQEYAANQAREEARHVTGFARYIETRWGSPLPVGDTLGNLLDEMVQAEEVYKKLVGMQMLVEGLAMGAFASIHAHTYDPLLKRLIQLVMTDEAFHHRFGKIWADRTVPKLSEAEHARVEGWAAQCFGTLLFNLINVEQKRAIYGAYGLEWEWVRDACKEVFSDEDRRESMAKATNIFRVLIKTLFKAGIITERTRHVYAAWVDLDEMKAEGDEMVGDAIAAEGIEFLKGINEGRRVIGQKPLAAAE